MEKGDGTAKMCVEGEKNNQIHKKDFVFGVDLKRDNLQMMEANFVRSRDVCLHIGLSAAAVCVDNPLTLSPDSMKRG